MLLPIHFVSIVLLCYLCIDPVLLDSLSCSVHFTHRYIGFILKTKILFFLQNVTYVWYNKNMDEKFCPLFLTDIDNCTSFDVKLTLFVKRSHVNVKPFKKRCFFLRKNLSNFIGCFWSSKILNIYLLFFYAKRHWASLFLK